MTPVEYTLTDPAATEWAIDDDVIQLREWGSDAIYRLPPADTWLRDVSIGSAMTCSLRLHDPAGQVSRLHARLVRGDRSWTIRDLGSKNGIRVDGAHRADVDLMPGVELGIGGLTLIAESPRSIALRGLLGRLLGWRAERAAAVDLALRSIRMAATHRVALVLRGDGDLVPVARSLHRRALGPDRPFIVCDPRRRQGAATVRSAVNYETGMPAFAAARGGSLCMRSLRLPRDFKSVVAALREPNARVQLVLCSAPSDDCSPYPAISVPPLSSRPDEVDQIIAEYAADAIADLGSAHDFLAADLEWVRMHSAAALPEIEKATRRLVAIRESRNLSRAAARLGMAPVSLSRWIGRRKLPMHVDV